MGGILEAVQAEERVFKEHFCCKHLRRAGLSVVVQGNNDIRYHLALFLMDFISFKSDLTLQ